MILAGCWLGVRAISHSVCSGPNFISNDVCDRWNIAEPPDDAVPAPPGWSIRWQELDCGSAGCGSRLYVLSPQPAGPGGPGAFLSAIQDDGWRATGGGTAQKGEVQVWVRPANDPLIARSIPPPLAERGNVYVSVALCGEGARCASSADPAG